MVIGFTQIKDSQRIHHMNYMNIQRSLGILFSQKLCYSHESTPSITEIIYHNNIISLFEIIVSNFSLNSEAFQFSCFRVPCLRTDNLGIVSVKTCVSFRSPLIGKTDYFLATKPRVK